MTHPDTHDNFIILIIITPGEDVEDKFNVNQPIRVVKHRALKGMPPGTNPDLFSLEYNDQALQDERKIKSYIEEFGWEDGTVLELVPHPEVI